MAFVAALLFLSAAVRLATLPDAVPAPPNALDLAAHLAASEAALDSAREADRPLGPGERLDLNRASASDFTRLPRVGDALARRMVENRERDGPFRSVDDLARVSGVGPATVARLAPHLEVTGVPRAAVAPRGAAAARRIPGPDEVARPDRVDINTASAEDLAALPGIGPAIAARIVAHRDSAGPWPAVDSLLAVKGIGPATLARLRRRLRVN